MGLKSSFANVKINRDGVADLIEFAKERLDEKDQKLLVEALDKTFEFGGITGPIIETFDGKVFALAIEKGVDVLFGLFPDVEGTGRTDG